MRRDGLNGTGQDRDDQGFTLIELMVSMTLLMLVSTALMFAYVQGLKASTQAQDRVSTTLLAKTASDNVTKALRTAVGSAPSSAAFQTAGPREVEFYAALGNRTGSRRSLDGAPVKVRIFADGTDLKITTITPPPGVYTWTATPVTRILAKDVAPGTLFRYYKSADLAAAGEPVSTVPLDASGVVMPDARATIRAVQFTLSLNTGMTGRQTPTTVTSLVTLLNQ